MITGKAFKHCVLHIGTEKTGTTTLQAALFLNRKTLAERGYFVPMSLTPYRMLANHEGLTTYALDDNNFHDDLRRKAGIHRAEQLVQHREMAMRNLRQEIAGRPLGSNTLLLSNEHCHSRLIRRSEVQALHEMLAEYVDSFEVLVYLRPQHDLAASLYDQALKAGYFDIDVLPDFETTGQRWVERRYFDYDDLLTRWGDVFGAAALRPRLYDRERLINGSILDDYFHQIGCPRDGVQVPPDRNTSIAATHQQTLLTINRFARANPGGVTPSMRSRLIHALGKLGGGPGRRPTRAAARAFYDKFAQSNENVRRKFFSNLETLFTPNFDKIPEQEAQPLPELDAVVRSLLAVVDLPRPGPREQEA